MEDSSLVAQVAYRLGTVVRAVSKLAPEPGWLGGLLRRWRSDDGPRRRESARSPRRRNKRSRSGGDQPRRASLGYEPALEIDESVASGELRRALTHPDPAVRAMALETVAEFDAERASAVLVSALNDPDAGVRCVAAEVTSRARAEGAVFALILALADEEPDVRAAAAASFAALCGKNVDLAGLDDPDERERTVQTLKDWWKQRRLSDLMAKAESPNGS